MGLTKTRSRKYVLLELGSIVTTEVHVLDADQPGGDFRLFAPRQQGVEVYLAHHGNLFYVLTNEDAVNFKLMKSPVEGAPDDWQEAIPHRPQIKLG